MEDYFGIITYLPVNLIRDDQSLARLKFREIGIREEITYPETRQEQQDSSLGGA